MNILFNISYGISIYTFNVSSPCQINFKYTGPSYPISIKNSSQSIIGNTSFISLTADNSNLQNNYNFTSVGIYNFVI
jgi:hypothetical protein